LAPKTCNGAPDPCTTLADAAKDKFPLFDALRSFSIRSTIAAKQTEASKQRLDEIVRNYKSEFIGTRFIL